MIIDPMTIWVILAALWCVFCFAWVDSCRSAMATCDRLLERLEAVGKVLSTGDDK